MIEKQKTQFFANFYKKVPENYDNNIFRTISVWNDWIFIMLTKQESIKVYCNCDSHIYQCFRLKQFSSENESINNS